jgi:hypothetical protein
VDTSPTYLKCIGGLSAPCTYPSDCASGSCFGNVCDAQHANGVACTYDQNCTSGICNRQTSTSTLSCLTATKPAGSYCHSNADCDSGACVTNVCAASKQNVGATCDLFDQNFPQESDGDCLSGACFNNRCINPGPLDAACDSDPDCAIPIGSVIPTNCGPRSLTDPTMVCKAP